MGTGQVLRDADEVVYTHDSIQRGRFTTLSNPQVNPFPKFGTIPGHASSSVQVQSALFNTTFE
jgi:hypothetical protein